MFTRELSSEGAATFVVAAAAVVAAAIAAGKFIQHQYEEKELAKHKAEIDQINEIYKRHLEKISVTLDSPVIEIKLPPIFDAEFHPTVLLQRTALQSLYEDGLSSTYPNSLAPYGQSILKAMRLLTAYHERRLDSRRIGLMKGDVGEAHDTTSAVLSYCMLMLSQYCVNFKGDAYEIACLKAMTSFLSAFVSCNKYRECSEQLAPVYVELDDALLFLEEHCLKLSMQDLIRQCRSDCDNFNDHMIRLCVQLIIPNEYWPQVPYLTLGDHDIAKKVVIPRYAFRDGNWENHIIRKLDVGYSEVLLPNCMLSDWLCYLAQQYDSTFKKSPSPVHRPEENFSSDTEIQKITEAVFRNGISNFLTNTAIDQEAFSATKKIVCITEKKKIDEQNKGEKQKKEQMEEARIKEKKKERIMLYRNIYQLVKRSISAQKFSGQIEDQMEELGTYYFVNSSQCDFIFDVLDGLSEQIRAIAGEKGLSMAVHGLKSEFHGVMLETQEDGLLRAFEKELQRAEQVVNVIKKTVQRHVHRKQHREYAAAQSSDPAQRLTRGSVGVVSSSSSSSSSGAASGRAEDHSHSGGFQGSNGSKRDIYLEKKKLLQLARDVQLEFNIDMPRYEVILEQPAASLSNIPPPIPPRPAAILLSHPLSSSSPLPPSQSTSSSSSVSSLSAAGASSSALTQAALLASTSKREVEPHESAIVSHSTASSSASSQSAVSLSATSTSSAALTQAPVISDKDKGKILEILENYRHHSWFRISEDRKKDSRVFYESLVSAKEIQKISALLTQACTTAKKSDVTHENRFFKRHRTGSRYLKALDQIGSCIPRSNV